MMEMSALYQLRAILLTLFMPVIVFDPVTSESCHSTILMDLMQCAEALAGAETSVPIAGGADPDLVESACKNGTFLAMITCAKSTLDKCSTEKIVQLLNKFIDPEEMNTSLSNFCSNTAVYRESSPCLLRQEKPIRKCVEEQVFITLNALRVAGDSMERRIHGVCSGYKLGIVCLDKVIRKACGNKIADVIKTVNGGQCMEKERQALSSSGALSKNITEMVSYFISFIFFKFIFHVFT